MIKHFTPLLAVFLLILLGGELFADEELTRAVNDYRQTIEELRQAEDRVEQAQSETQREEAQGEVEQSQSEVERVEAEIQEKFSDVSDTELRQFFNEIPDLSSTEKYEIQQAIAGRNQCGNSWWSVVCRVTRDDSTDGLYSQRLETRYEQETENIDNYQEKNTIIADLMSSEIQDLQGLDGFEGCDFPNAECRSKIRSYCEQENCGDNEEVALGLFNTAADNYLIPKSGMIRAAEFLDVSPGAFAAADTIQDLLGFEFSLIENGSGIDELLTYGTPEQVCLAKVDSFISVNGAQVEGQEVEIRDDATGMTSRIRACDNMEFEICADLRAERSQVYFNNSFTLIAHFYVYNPNDYNQEVIINAEFFDSSRNKETFNIFEKSSQGGKSITIEPKSRKSMSIQIPNTQVFKAKTSEIFGNVVMGVYNKETGGIEYTIDYPIIAMGSQGVMTREEKAKQVDNSGAQIVSGTTTPTSNLIDRVSLS